MRQILTDITIQKLKHSPQIYWDTNLPAFGIRIGKNVKTFVVSKGKDRKLITLGRYPHITLKAARTLAMREMSKTTHNEGITLREAILRFTEHSRGRVKPATLNQYISYLNQMDLKAPREITYEDIKKALWNWNGKPWAQNYAYASVRNFLNWCLEHGFIDKSPLFRKLPPNKTRSRERLLSDSEVARIWRCSGDGSTYANIIRLLFLTGQRRMEVRNLTPADVHDDLITFHTKGDKYNTLPLTPLISEHLTLPFSFNNWGVSKDRFDRDCGVLNWRHHDARRYFASTMARLGVDFFLIERMLGHSMGKVQATYQRYGYMKEMRDALILYHSHLEKISATLETLRA